jgi:hypothetical protein
MYEHHMWSLKMCVMLKMSSVVVRSMPYGDTGARAVPIWCDKTSRKPPTLPIHVRVGLSNCGLFCGEQLQLAYLALLRPHGWEYLPKIGAPTVHVLVLRKSILA